MNRELKFRIYSFLDKSFIYFNIYNYPSGIAGGVSEPQQYTGLKDKNGVEIYDDDILEQAEEFSDCIPDGININDKRIVRFPTDARSGLIFRGKIVGKVQFYNQAFRFRNNIIGLTQLVDSRIIDCSFNKNDYAIIMKKNSGFSTILGNRIEWNNQRAITVINAHDVTISNNEFDRNSKAGLVVDNLEV